MSQSEIESEQTYLDYAHERLDAMREAARAVSAEVVGESSGGTFAARVERDIRVQLSSRRLAELDIGDAAVAFGRLDFESGLRIYVGRVGVSDENGDQLVVDWRAPVAEAFYRATPEEPLGVVRRRHFITRGRVITGLDDELLDREAAGRLDGLVLVGEGALLASLERARTGRMQDIVATIQSEQDRIIRSRLSGVLVVQGGPGTGKTAVALHRAAYLLYSHRRRLARDGVLLVGPSPVFLRYVEQVLPSLGESSVELATPGELYAGGARARGEEEPAVAELKGDARMGELLARAVETRERPLRRPLELSYGAHELSLPAAETRRVVEAVRRRRGTHNARRPGLERMLARALLARWREAERRLGGDGSRRGSGRDEEAAAAGIAASLRRDPGARAALERMWPLLTPEELLHDLFGSPALLRAAARGLLDKRETELLLRERSPALREIPWTWADISLLDEAARLLGPARRGSRRRAGREREDEAWMLDRVLDESAPECPECGAQLVAARGPRTWHCQQCGRRWRPGEVAGDGEGALGSTVRDRLALLGGPGEGPAPQKGARVYGHLIVDEAQAVTPLQWRALARRCPARSLTVVGDLSQGTSRYAPRSWDEALGPLGTRAAPRVEELTVNYRTPAEVMAVAAGVLERADPSLRAPVSVRRSGERPRALRAAPGLVAEVVCSAAATERRAVGEGKVALVAPEPLVAELGQLLRVPAARGGASQGIGRARELLAAPVAAVGLDAARGLEFDSVVLVEPSLIAAERAHGLRALYVAMTRTTRRLCVVHSADLPPGLDCMEPA